jgi:hypothetical protein
MTARGMKMCDHTFRETSIAAISSGSRLMMPLAYYATNEGLGVEEFAADALTQRIQEETPKSENNYLVNQLKRV